MALTENLSLGPLRFRLAAACSGVLAFDVLAGQLNHPFAVHVRHPRLLLGDLKTRGHFGDFVGRFANNLEFALHLVGQPLGVLHEQIDHAQ